MKKHNGMRPLDIVVLLKIAAMGKQNWQNKDLALALKLSPSEISESLNRSMIAGLIDQSKKKLFKKAFLEFLNHGLKYVFPQQPGALTKGIPTAHAAPVAADTFGTGEMYVWPAASGIARGQAIEPLYPTVPEVATQDPELYDLLALADMLRVGRVRETKFASEKLKALFYGTENE